MATPISKQEKRVLVFNPLKRLIAICQSNFSAARLLNVNPRRINDACSGKQISTSGFYFRFLQDDIDVTFEDLGKLDVREYDELCGVTRDVYRTKAMSRVGRKYNTKKKQKEAQK